MTQIIAYLSFNGNCREAMLFYQCCFGGKLSLQTVEDSPISSELPIEMKNNILHASLINDGFVLMGSDMIGTEEFSQGNSISLMYHCYSEKELRSLYQQLHSSSQSNKTEKRRNLYADSYAVEVVDIFGVRWLLKI